MARLMLRSERQGKDAEAKKTLEVVAKQYEKTRWAPLALLVIGQIEELQDVPAAMLTYDRIAREYTKSDVHGIALRRLAALYEKQKLYEPAAETFGQLAKAHPGNADEAWFRSGEIYRRRLNDPAKARAAYMNVTAASRYFADAQKYLKAE
jgi:TolA-binding protein